MKRVIAAIAGTIALLYMVLGFKATPQTVAESDIDTSVTEPETIPTIPQESTTTTAVPAEPGDTSTTTAAPTTTTQRPKRTIVGDSVTTDWGHVQVSITVQGKKIVAVSASLPNYPPDVMAKPKLISESLQAQSANIAVVSGATYTSQAWKQSLAAAIKKAGI